MTFCLESTIIEPEKDKDIKNIIVLLHGYGGDGKDISMLTLNWKRHLPNTIFICPNGHELCTINPTGYQWFDLTKDDPSYILKESYKAEKKLNKFLDEVKEFFKETDGGAVPIGSAAAALGIQKRRLYDLIDMDLVNSVQFTNPDSKHPTILVPLKEIDRLHTEGVPKPKMGRPRK